MTGDRLKDTIKEQLPASALFLLRATRHLTFPDALASSRFLATPLPRTGFGDRWRILRRFYETTLGVDCAHTQDEMLRFAANILRVPAGVEGCVVEAGCFKGRGTAKFSVAAKLAGRRLLVFDSFEGLPVNSEQHRDSIFGERPDFSAGRYLGALEEVQHNVAVFGEPQVCEYLKGWFEQTMPGFSEPVVAAYLDVDLVSSTKTCLKHLYPLLQPGGYLYCQDAHLPLIIELLNDAEFWLREVGCDKPAIMGLGRRKLVRMQKPGRYPG